MAGAVNIGTLQGVLAMRDEFSAQLAKLESRLKVVEEGTKRTTRVTQTETEKINAAYKKVAASLDPVVKAQQRYEAQQKTLNAALQKGIITQAEYNHQLGLAKTKYLEAATGSSRLTSILNSAGSQLLSQITTYIGITAAIGAVVSVSKQFIQANLDAEASAHRVQEAVRRYGERSGVTAEQVDKIAQSVSRLTGIDDELIADAETIGLKFNRIGSDIFPRFSQAAIDLSVATGMDLSGAFEKAGKLVNQPLRALTLFAKEGYAVGKSQSDLIKSLVAAGDIELAQVEILKILEGQYGGAAAAARDTLGGAFHALGTSWENLLEKFGEGHISPIRSAVEALISLIDSMTDSIDEVGLGWQIVTMNTLEGINALYRLEATIRDKIGADSKDLKKTITDIQKDIDKLEIQTLQGQGYKISDDVLKSYGLLRTEHKKGTGAALEQTEAESKLGDAAKKAYDSVQQSIDEYLRKVSNLRLAYVAALLGVKAYNAELLRQKISEAIIKEENKLREVGGRLTEKQVLSIRKAVTEEDELNRKLKETQRIQQETLKVALTSVDNTAIKGFDADFKRFVDNAHRGMELFQIDVNSMLDGLSKIRDLDLDVEFNSRLMDVEPGLRKVEADYLSFLESIGSGFEQAGENAIEAGERILDTLAFRFIGITDKIREHLQTLNEAPAIEALQQSGRSSSQVYRDEVTEINRLREEAAKQGIDITEGATKEINNLTSKRWDENLSIWASGFGMLADQFGGFFKYLSQAINTLQQAKGMSDSFSGMASSMGAGSGAASAMGAFGAYLVIAKAMYDAFKSHTEARQERKYNYAAVFSKDSGADWTTSVEKQAMAVSHQIQRTAEAFAEAIGGSIRAFADFEIQVRRDGKYFKAFVEGELVGQFESVEEATSAALLAAFTSASTSIRGLSELVKEGLSYLITDIGKLKFNNLEDAGEFLKSLREIAELTWSDAASATLASVRHLDSLWETLQKLNSVTPQTVQGYNDLIASEVNAWRAWSDSITGREKTREEILAEKKADAVLLEAQKAFRIAELNLKVLDLQSQKAYLEGKGRGLEIDGKIKQGDLEINKGYLIAKGQLLGAELTLNEQYIAALQLEINAIQTLIQSLIDIPAIDIDKIKIPKGGRGGQKDNIKDWIDDKRYDLDTRSLDEWAKKAAAISREYDKEIEQAGKDKKLRAELLALKERELQLLAQEQMAATKSSYGDFTGHSNSFTDVKKTAQDLIDSINNSPFGDPEKASMIAGILAEVNAQIEELSLQSAANLFGSLIGDLEKYGMSENQMAGYRQQLAIIEHTLKVAHYRAEFAILQANGSLSQEILAMLGRAIDFVAGVDPTKFMDESRNSASANDNFSSSVDSTANELDRLRESLKSAKEKILDTVREFDRGQFGAVTPEASWAASSKQFEDILAKAKAGDLESLQAAPEAFKNALDTLKEFSPALYASEAFRLRDKLESLGNIETIKQGNLVITDFERRNQHREVVKTLSSGFESLSSLSGEQASTLTQILAEQQQATAANQELKTRLIRLESGTFGKREIA